MQEAAEKRVSIRRSTLRTLGWAPWWSFTIARRVPRGAFEPPPPVDAAMLEVRWRSSPLLPPSDRPAYLALLGSAFRSASRPLALQVRGRMAPRPWKRFARERGIALGARPFELDVYDWVAIFRLQR